MRIALIGGGQPRFTPDFLHLMDQLQGFDRADIYLNFWTSSWASSEDEARKKIEAILKPKYHLSKVQLVDQPSYQLPPCGLYHPPAQPENVRWAYERRIGMWLSTKMAFDMIEEDYDLYIKFRPDGMLDRTIDLSVIDRTSLDLIYPAYPRHGRPGHEVCDQFVIGSKEGMAFYCSLVDRFRDYVPVVCANWEKDIHCWASEHILAHHIESNNKLQTIGDYGHLLATQGRSKFTDRHFHVPITKDPTEL